MTDKIPARQKIIDYLNLAGEPMAIHEIIIPGVSQNAIGTRLPELANEGIVIGTVRAGTRVKEWSIVPQDLTLPLA